MIVNSKLKEELGIELKNEYDVEDIMLRVEQSEWYKKEKAEIAKEDAEKNKRNTNRGVLDYLSQNGKEREEKEIKQEKEQEKLYREIVLKGDEQGRKISLDIGKQMLTVSILVIQDVVTGKINLIVSTKKEVISGVKDNTYQLSNGENIYCSKVYSDNIERRRITDYGDKLSYTSTEYNYNGAINLKTYDYNIVLKGYGEKVEEEERRGKKYYKGTKIRSIQQLSEEEVVIEVLKDSFLYGIVEYEVRQLKEQKLKKIGGIRKVQELTLKDGKTIVSGQDYDKVSTKDGVKYYSTQYTTEGGVTVYVEEYKPKGNELTEGLGEWKKVQGGTIQVAGEEYEITAEYIEDIEKSTKEIVVKKYKEYLKTEIDKLKEEIKIKENIYKNMGEGL